MSLAQANLKYLFPHIHVRMLQVFSQWKDALLVVSKALSAHSIEHVSLTGSRQGKVCLYIQERSEKYIIWLPDSGRALLSEAHGAAMVPHIKK